MKLKSKWTFARATGPSGFLRSQRVSTDALNALMAWRAGRQGRSFSVIDGAESPDHLSAILTVDDVDAAAGDDLTRQCYANGVDRQCLD